MLHKGQPCSETSASGPPRHRHKPLHQGILAGAADFFVWINPPLFNSSYNRAELGYADSADLLDKILNSREASKTAPDLYDSFR